MRDLGVVAWQRWGLRVWGRVMEMVKTLKDRKRMGLSVEDVIVEREE